MLLDQSVMWSRKVTNLWCDSEVKSLSNDYTNPNTNPRNLMTLTLTLTNSNNTFWKLFCAGTLWPYAELFSSIHFIILNSNWWHCLKWRQRHRSRHLVVCWWTEALVLFNAPGCFPHPIFFITSIASTNSSTQVILRLLACLKIYAFASQQAFLDCLIKW